MQVSCATSTPVLSNRERFPNYFQLLPSNLEFADTYFGVIREFNWRHVVILLQNENLFTLVTEGSNAVLSIYIVAIILTWKESNISESECANYSFLDLG